MKDKRLNEIVTKGYKMPQLDTMGTKISGMDLSLTSSKTPRRRKCGGSLSGSLCGSLSGSMGGGLAGGALGGTHGGSVPRLAGTNRPNSGDARELEGLRSALHDRETLIQNLRAQLGLNTSSNRSQRVSSSSAGSLGATNAPPLSEQERPLAEQRLSRLRTDADGKRAAIRGLKGALQRLDITDNIDVRIRQAELEYALGREELDLLSISEELRTLQSRLDQTQGPPEQRRTIYSWLRAGAHLSLLAVQVSCDPTRPRWGASGGPATAAGLYVDWAADGEPLHRGDRLLEVNGKLLTSRSREELSRLLAVSYDPAEIVVLRHRGATQNSASHHSSDGHRHRSSTAHGSSALRADNLRLTHRISYLEEQVRELQAKEQQHMAHVTSISITSPPASPPGGNTLDNNPGLGSGLISSAMGTEAVEVFRRGSHVTTLLHGKVVKPHVQQSQLNGYCNGQQQQPQHINTSPTTKPEDAKNNHANSTNNQYNQPSNQNHQDNQQRNQNHQDSQQRNQNHQDNQQRNQNNHMYHQTRLINGYHHYQTQEEKWRKSLERSINGESRSESRTSLQSNNSRNGPLTNKDLQNIVRNSNTQDSTEDNRRNRLSLNHQNSEIEEVTKITENVDKDNRHKNIFNGNDTQKLGGSITNVQQACLGDRKDGFVNDLIRNIDMVNDTNNSEKSRSDFVNKEEITRNAQNSQNEIKNDVNFKDAAINESGVMSNGDMTVNNRLSLNNYRLESEENNRIGPDYVPASNNSRSVGNLVGIENSRNVCSLGADMQYDGSRPPMQKIPPDRPERPERPEARRRSRNKMFTSTESADEATLFRNKERHHHSRRLRERINNSGEILIDNILVDQIDKIRDDDDKSSMDGGGRQWDERSSKSLEFERCSGTGMRPTPPKKPLRLSLHRARSLQTVTPGVVLPDQPHQNGAELYSKVDSKRPSKRTHTHAHSVARRLQQQV